MDADGTIDIPGAAACRNNDSRIDIKAVSRSPEATAGAHDIPKRYPIDAGAKVAEMLRLLHSAVEIPERTEYTSGTDSGTPASGDATDVFSRGVRRYYP